MVLRSRRDRTCKRILWHSVLWSVHIIETIIKSFLYQYNVLTSIHRIKLCHTVKWMAEIRPVIFNCCFDLLVYRSVIKKYIWRINKERFLSLWLKEFLGELDIFFHFFGSWFSMFPKSLQKQRSVHGGGYLILLLLFEWIFGRELRDTSNWWKYLFF